MLEPRKNRKVGSRVEYDGLTIDMEEYQVVAFGQKMTFTAKEMELLWCLATNPGKAFSRNQLLEPLGLFLLW